MANNDFGQPTQILIESFEIDDKDVIGLFASLSYYENIFSPVITGNITIIDTDGSRFIEDNQIEFNEKIKFSFKNANDESLEFEGRLNGMTNKVIKQQQKVYNIDFTSEAVRKNESKFITKAYRDKKPEDIVKEMIQEIGGQEDKVDGTGLPMTFSAARKRPTEVIRYVLTHGITTGQDSPSTQETEGSQEGETKGTTGFLCWETLDGYRFADVQTVRKGEAGEDAGEFRYQLANRNLSMDESLSGIIEYDFQRIGDFQSKLRSGAFKNKVITYDVDTGQYTEFEYNDDKNMSEKQKKALQDAGDTATRIMTRMFCNERFENSCEKAQKEKHDQSKQFLAQNQVSQNTFDDQCGTFTLPPHLTVRAGDKMKVRIPKVESEKGQGIDEKHSGQYVIRQVGHHFYNNGHAYTKLTTIRSTVQQDDATSQQ